MSRDELVTRAKTIIKNNIYLTLGTTNEDNTPWISPLYYAYDESINFYWISPKNSWHSQNIRRNKTVSIVIFDSHAPKWTGVGVYILAMCSELNNPKDALDGLKLEFARLADPIPPLEDFLGESEYRVSKAVPYKVWVTSESEVNGKKVDARLEIELQKLTGQEWVLVK